MLLFRYTGRRELPHRPPSDMGHDPPGDTCSKRKEAIAWLPELLESKVCYLFASPCMEVNIF